MTDNRSSRGKTILVVEDNASLREMVREVLESEGYEVLEAGDPDQALSISRSRPGTIHLALTDVIQPKMSGRELADRLLEARPGLGILFMSGYPQEMTEASGVSRDAAQFIEKPFTTAALLAKIRAIIGRRSDHP